MEHQFNVDVAIKYGVDKAILIHNIAWWINKNIANNNNFHDGKYWTYNSSEAFSKLFPYMNNRKIERLLRELEKDDNVLISGNYNKSKLDRTKWYSITDKFILQIYTLQSQKIENGNSNNGAPIPDSKPYSKQNNNKNKKFNLLEYIQTLDISKELKDCLNKFISYMIEVHNKKYKTSRVVDSFIKKFNDGYYGNINNFDTCIEYSMQHEWQDIYIPTELKGVIEKEKKESCDKERKTENKTPASSLAKATGFLWDE